MITHVPEDMTVTVTADTSLAALQAELAKRGQWLPIDPPGAEQLTVRALLDGNLSGPRRFGFGTIREHLIGIKVRLVNGRLIKAGGQVVKNVAGYDLCKLFVGAQGTLGTIEEATFKLRPLPEVERLVQRRCATLDEAGALIKTVMDSALTPVVLDSHNLANPRSPITNHHVVVLGFAGTREEVDWQLGGAVRLGVNEPATLDYSRDLPQRASVLPSKLVETIKFLDAKEFIARAGNGVIYFRGGVDVVGRPESIRGGDQSEHSLGALALQHRLKDAFDPKHALPELHS